MCMFSSPSAPSAPPPPPPIEPPPPPPQSVDATVRDARAKTKQEAMLKAGHAGTIKTAPRGLLGSADQGPGLLSKKMLGGGQ